MATQTLTELYDSYEAAQMAARDLEDAGISHADLSILTNNSDGRINAVDTRPGGEDGARVGAAAGTVLGAGAGLLAGLGVFAIPGIGQVAAAGWLISTVVGAGLGAGFGSAAGGLIGSLTEAGLTEEQAHFYAEAVRRGSTALFVKASEDQVPVVREILHRHEPVESTAREQAYRQAGWTAFDENAPAYTTEQIEQERRMYKPYRGPQL